jgi:fibrillarin-like pre-rRNA processing protein
MSRAVKTNNYGIFNVNGKLATKSIRKGFRVHGEAISKDGEDEYRIWDPNRSKLCAAVKKGLKTWPFQKGSKVLYLGASAGVTVSFISDIVEDEGRIYAVEFAPNSMRDLIIRCENRENVWPILADARMPDKYKFVEECDVLFEDVAQPDQDRILIENARYLKKGGIAMIAVKSQSIDVRLKPQEVYEKVLTSLKKEFDILEKFNLDPFEKHHMFIVGRKK